MSESTKLTKNQKKSLAFRERKVKGKAEEPEDVPVSENQDEAEAMQVEEEKVAESKEETPKRPPKRRREETEEESEAVAEAKPAKKPKNVVSQRYIVFVGNLQYETTAEQVLEHFKSCGGNPRIRLLTPKEGKASKNFRKRSKGYAFVEFYHAAALQDALKLHGSELDSREINVELTSGGGGTGQTRLNKIQKANKKLLRQREKQLKKANKARKEPQRHSSTSGAEKVHTNKKTWTVGNTEEENKGGKRGSKYGSKRRPHPNSKGPLLTGSNTIQVQ